MNRRRFIETPNFALVEPASLAAAARFASEALSRVGVQHALIGGAAVAAYGYIRATKDVDFLVADNAFDTHGGGIVTLRPGVPIASNGIPVDVLGVDRVTRDGVVAPPLSEELPIIAFEALIYLKLLAFRRRDQEDIIELFKLGHDDKTTRKFLVKEAPSLVWRFDRLSEHFNERD